ncbi:MAG: ribonuclease H-like domain-containing protein [bacterium]|nr:ribonuclease H-like domain-containing protein [bacterium]
MLSRAISIPYSRFFCIRASSTTACPLASPAVPFFLILRRLHLLVTPPRPAYPRFLLRYSHFCYTYLMLINTFCHIPRVGPRTEARLWQAGILSWHDALLPCHRSHLLRTNPASLDILHHSFAALDARDIHFFAQRLPHHELWRLFPEFRQRTAFLDIETTGLSGIHDHVTTITLYDGKLINYYVYGHNLTAFLRDIRRYQLLVTYNGKHFDIPYLERFFHTKLPHVHIDLRFLLHSLGFSGGLKACEHALGLHRGSLDGIDGSFAVLLWRDYVAHANLAALETLLAYNTADAVNLETLLVKAYNLCLQATPFHAARKLPLPEPPPCPFSPDSTTIARLKACLPPLQ